MSDNQGGNAGAGGDGGTDGKGGNGSSQQGGGTAGGADDRSLNDERSANKLIKDFAKARGVTVAQLMDQFQGLEAANKTEVERARDAAKEWERKHGELSGELRAERAEKAIRDAAAAAGARADRLASVYRLVRDGVEYGDDGKPKNVAALVEQAKTDAPEFFARVSGSGDGGKGGGDGKPDANAAINSALRQAAGYASN